MCMRLFSTIERINLFKKTPLLLLVALVPSFSISLLIRVDWISTLIKSIALLLKHLIQRLFCEFRILYRDTTRGVRYHWLFVSSKFLSSICCVLICLGLSQTLFWCCKFRGLILSQSLSIDATLDGSASVLNDFSVRIMTMIIHQTARIRHDRWCSIIASIR